MYNRQGVRFYNVNNLQIGKKNMAQTKYATQLRVSADSQQTYEKSFSFARNMQIKTTTRHYLKPTRVGKIEEHGPTMY